VGHVAAISNDPPGNLNPDCADVINGAQPEVDATT
jgi:hypothetical protein